MYALPIRPNEIYHFGTKEHSGRYPWGSGNRPKQRLEKPKISQEEKAERSRQRREKAKKIAKTVGNIALKSALTGATVAAKVVFSSAVTSATLVGIAAAGYQAITSPEMSALIDHIGVKAGEYVADMYIRKGARYVDANLDEVIRLGDAYLRSI